MKLENRLPKAARSMGVTEAEAAAALDGVAARHTPGAIRAAEIITGGKYGEPDQYPTEYGAKTVEGYADLIDRETHAQDLLELAKLVAEYFEGTDAPLGIAARAAIAKATS